MSKKEKTPKVKKEKKPKEKKLTDIQYIKIDMVLRMFKNNLPLYIEYEGDKQLCKTFCGLNRSVIYDITSCSFFKLGLISDEALKKLENTVQEHPFNRTLSSKVIFKKLKKNPDMTIEEFIEILKKYGTTITLTVSEHIRLSTNTMGFYVKTIEDFNNNGVYVNGLQETIAGWEPID